jgi:hypothetical protein
MMSQPHTGSKLEEHDVESGTVVQLPPRMMGQSPCSGSQNCPDEHVPPVLPPQAAPSTQAPLVLTVTPTASAKQELLYVVPSQPHTGDTVVGQVAGIGVQTPPASAEQSPVSSLQNSSSAQVSPALPPHAPPVTHSPVCDTLTPAAAARQALSYVVPSHPQTGATVVPHELGMIVQTPSASSEHTPVVSSQNCPVLHVTPVLPPQALEHWPTVSPCLRCAGTACSLMQIVFAPAGFPGGMWQMHTVLCDFALAIVVARMNTERQDRLETPKTRSIRFIDDPPPKKRNEFHTAKRPNVTKSCHGVNAQVVLQRRPREVVRGRA